MDDVIRKDLEAIENLHQQDIAATKASDFKALKSLMDADCMVFPPDGDPSVGQAYLDHARASSSGSESQSELLELVQEWEEVKVLGDFAYEQGVVRYAVQDAKGSVLRETQRLMRILRRQQNGTWRVYRAMWHAPRRPSKDTTGEKA